MDHSRYNQPGQLQPEMDSRQHNRFSWQAPLQEEARTYEEPQQHMPPQQPQQPQPSTDVSSRHFSYAQTPAEHRAFVYTSSPNDPPLPQTRISVAASLFTPIDPRPQSMLDPNFVAPPVPQLAYVPPSYSQDEKPPISLPAHHNHNEQQYHHHPAQRMVMPQPAHDPQTNTQQTRHARQMSNLSPINTNLTARPMPPIPPTPQSGTQTSPLPYKTPISATSTTQPNPAQTSPPPTSPRPSPTQPSPQSSPPTRPTAQTASPQPPTNQAKSPTPTCQPRRPKPGPRVAIHAPLPPQPASPASSAPASSTAALRTASLRNHRRKMPRIYWATARPMRIVC
ncbi:hypothetical protein T440DRAFT_507326 [Plenodomus tracheiphilus IPT5]|uniref:Uncharacterized protein n=1 Tax=Plenodomus tracheiphilus IPT5 TaxID=1408161 RepID=A0A6A7B7B0_9PLEO|nr:hypothetical protein T440DRAFT_507326 [Plenodomus tracheiphilus IPT5]